MQPNCIVHKNKALLISICILVATFFCHHGHLSKNKEKRNKIKYKRQYIKQIVKTRNENTIFKMIEYVCTVPLFRK